VKILEWKKEKVKKLNGLIARISFSLFHVSTFPYYRPDGADGRGAADEPPIGRCWRKRRRLRLRAFADFSLAFWPGGMK